MRMSFARALLATVFFVPAIQANAQESPAGEMQLPEVVADGERAQESYVMGAGIDSGTTRITEKEIRARAPGSGDANQLLKVLPTVQFRHDEFLATRENIQDIRPSDISISGGRFYENLFTIDGIDANSRLDVTQASPSNLQEPSGASAQSLWVDSNLVGEIVLRDSNVSAEHGRFTGGAVEIRTRAPRREFGMTGTVAYSSDALTRFKVSEAANDALAGELPPKPSFESWRFGATADLPVADDVGVLLGYNRSRSRVVYTKAANYGGTPYGQASINDNFLAKVQADLTADLTLSGQFTYTPYESESEVANSIDAQMVTHGGGIGSRIELAKAGETNWSVAASFARANTSRDAPDNLYTIASWTEIGRSCSTSASCVVGSFGDIRQRQDTYALTGRWSAPAGPGRLSMGFDYQRIEAMRRRLQNNYAYLTTTAQSAAGSIVCAEPDSLTCKTGEYALTTRMDYLTYRAEANIDSLATWAEYEMELGAFSLRAGLRYDYESFLGNGNLAPRFSASYALPWSGWSLTLGANRYYGRSMVAYALREQYPDSFTYVRTGKRSRGQITYSDADWTLSTTSHSASYADGNKKTPYSDELTVAMSGRVLGGDLRVKGIYREGKDEFSRSAGEAVTKVLTNGRTVTYQEYTIANDGYSKYRGASIEWTRSFGKHALALNANLSRTKRGSANYLETIDEDRLVAFQGSVVNYADLMSRKQLDDMAKPFIANMTWTALWLDDRVTTNVNLRYTGKFKRIEDTDKTTRIDGVSYDVFDYVAYPNSVDVNLNAQAELVRSSYGVLTADVRVANLLDRIPSPNRVSTSQPYQYGRSFWLGLNYRF